VYIDQVKSKQRSRENNYIEQAERVLDSVNYCSIVEDVNIADSLSTCDHCGELAYFPLLRSCLNCND